MTSDEYATWKNTFEADVHKKQMSNIMDQCGKYDEACNKACVMLMSFKYMTDDVHTMVVEHPLFNKVLSNTDPDEEEIERYALGQIIITDVNADGVISKKLESYKPDTSAEARSSSRGKKTAVAAEENVKITFANRPVSSGIRSKNLVLLLKIIRAVVLRLSPDSQQLQINELDRC